MCFVFSPSASTQPFTLSLHDALPIWSVDHRAQANDQHRDLERARAAGGRDDQHSRERERRRVAEPPEHADQRDRKSTRLNSSHTVISYAVFCLKKKTHDNSVNKNSIA